MEEPQRKFTALLESPVAWGLILILILGWLFGEITREILTQQGLIRLDYWVLAHSGQIQSRSFTQIMTIITTLGGPFVIWPVAIGTTAFFICKRRVLSTVFFVSVVGGGRILEGFLKDTIHRARPIPPLGEVLGHGQGWSYPSAHAMLSVLFYITLAYFLAGSLKSKINRALLFGAAFFLSLLIAASRVYLQVHFLSDVLAGLIAGLLWFTLCLTVLEHFKKRFE